jgi:hypothetical protein
MKCVQKDIIATMRQVGIIDVASIMARWSIGRRTAQRARAAVLAQSSISVNATMTHATVGALSRQPVENIEGNRGNRIAGYYRMDDNPDGKIISKVEGHRPSTNEINFTSGLQNSILEFLLQSGDTIPRDQLVGLRVWFNKMMEALIGDAGLPSSRCIPEIEPVLGCASCAWQDGYISSRTAPLPVESSTITPVPTVLASDNTMVLAHDDLDRPRDRLTPIAPAGKNIDDEIFVGSREEAGLESVEFLRAMKPADYRESRWWRDVRNKVLVGYGCRCAVCREAASEVHHLTYLSVGKETWRDVVAICHKHHRFAHFPEDMP